METFFTTGISGFDELLGKLNPRTTILIVGHPGSGKTTLASKICYENTLRNHKCLYISFYEDREKLFRNMSKLGIMLEEAESRNLLTHVKLPIVTTNDVLKIITELVLKDAYKVVVIDSINPIIEIYDLRSEARAILLNFFYQLASLINGLLVLVAELPIGSERVELGAVDFVSDITIYLKHRVVYGLLVRILEIRKHREAPLSVVEIPYTIEEKVGLKIFPPTRIERILKIGEFELKTTLSIIRELIGKLYKGDVVFISYPPSARDPHFLISIADLAITNGLKVLGISYKYSVDEIVEVFNNLFSKYLGFENIDVSDFLNKMTYIISLNPASCSIYQIQARTIELIEKLDPGIVVFHGIDVLNALVHDVHDYWSTVINTLFWLKNKGILVLRIGARVDPTWTRLSEAVSDIVVRVHYKRKGLEFIPYYYIWRRGARPRIYEISEFDIKRTLEEARLLREKLHRIQSTQPKS